MTTREWSPGSISCLSPPTPPKTTSPDSPTPSGALPTSGVDKVIAELRNRRRGRLQEAEEKEEKEEWWCISLSIDEFNSLEARIEVDDDLYGFKYLVCSLVV
ncbi:hypothetical protein F4820DRAFT_275558 [Hypoxylon rubiginosum]|uniref:Uncharacterized protein n=1 Tax=Hypoxylon rubiginosum TaxID=110542 RepID=A0ACB9Z380_9PEZI|nr:hypothetical protein F4820DRAFT_275558 [Hypoxylon rubiginosum]